MAFIPSRNRPPTRPARTSGPVYAVGQRAFVHCPTERLGAVVLSDERGNPIATGLDDGAEVEVVAWRPRGSTGTRYRVRARRDGSDGWLAADHLRTTAAPPTPATVPVDANPSLDAAGPRFGRRR